MEYSDLVQRVRGLATRALSATKRARRIRTEGEFDLARLVSTTRAPATPSAAYSWDLSEIMSGRDSQFSGRFATPARLVESMRTDDAISVAEENRLAPAQMINVALTAAKGARADSIAAEGDALFGPRGSAITREAMTPIRMDYVAHGVGIGVLHWTPRADGSRVDVELRHWPIEHVWWDSVARCLLTRVDTTAPRSVYGLAPRDGFAIERGASGLGVMPIVHGDGRWVVLTKSETMPWRRQAALLPACMVWARHAFASRDWAKGSASHGNAKVIGELPEGVSLQIKDESGNAVTSPEASEFIDLLVDVASLDTPVGVRPFGSKIEYITNGSRAWEVWRELMANAERSAHRIYNGTDGALGSVGGAPGIDVEALFGVARTRVEGDLTCETNAIRTGVIEPWAAINFGDSRLAPLRAYLLPDSDGDASAESYAKRSTAFWADVASAKANGCIVDQAYLDALGSRYGIDVPTLPEAPAPAAPAETEAPPA